MEKFKPKYKLVDYYEVFCNHCLKGDDVRDGDKVCKFCGHWDHTILGIYTLTLPMNKFRGFSGYARTIVPRYRPMGLPGPLWYFTGLDFTQKPNFRNHVSKLLKNFGEQTFEPLPLLTVYRSPMLETLYNG